ncbi:MAG: deoxyribose-phosphate aldolase [Minwuiales bacterium]|nr:deoxyribose-phosphate aldolase [Minwuiales bacterium]
MTEDNKDLAARALPLLDLTSLNDGDTDADIRALCRRAETPAGAVAAVCIYPRFVATARSALGESGVRIATVANFPNGETDIAKAVAEATAAVADGADEIDVVMPYAAYAVGDVGAAIDLIAATKEACGARTLKVILETCRLADPGVIAAASRDAIAAGANFLKTSTGKAEAGATPAAARVMLEEIAASGRRDVGFKAAGGIRTVADAALYLALADEIMGPDWAGPATFRFGASGLLDALLGTLGMETGKPAGSSY